MMATATATASHTYTTPSTLRAAMAATSAKAKAAKAAASSSSSSHDPPPSVSVQRDETWVRQLEEQQQERFSMEAGVVYKEFLVELEAAGPFASPETRAELQQRYDDRIEQMRKMQHEELEQHIEMERQERLWSLGIQDDGWDGWSGLVQEQASILASIRRESGRSGGINTQGRSMEDMIKQNEREAEELRRRNDEWNKLEHQRKQDRAQWAERTRATNFHLKERRERDMEEAGVRIAQSKAMDEKTTRLEADARQNAAQLRGQASYTALNPEIEAMRRSTLPLLSETSSRASVSDSIFSTSPTATDTPQSSVYGGNTSEPQRWHPVDTVPPRPGAPRSTPIPIPDPLRRSGSGPTSGSSPPSRSRPPGMQTTPSPSPLSGTPTSNTMAHAKGEEPPRPKVWIPPEGARDPPSRKGSMQFEGTREPIRKSSLLFGASPGPSPSPTLEEPSTKTQPRPAPSPQPPFQPPSAPPTRPQPLPQGQPQFGPATQAQSQSQSRPSAASQPPPSATYPSAPPTSATYSSQPQSSTAYTTQPQSSTNYSFQPPPTASFNETKRRPEDTAQGSAAPRSATTSTFSSAGPKVAPSPMSSSTRPATTPMRAAPSTKPPPTPMKPAPAPAPAPTSIPDDWRGKLRTDYVKAEAQRVEDERRRREEEENERRAEEARRRGAENRRKEEQAREAERREADRKARASGKAPHIPAGPERSVVEVWTAYENQWAAMASASQLRFRSIPWPVLMPVSAPEMLLPIQIAAFILNPQHSTNKPRKDRLREALLRWHPDRFESKWLKKVVEDERETVKEGVGLVVRALNDLLSAEGTFSG